MLDATTYVQYGQQSWTGGNGCLKRGGWLLAEKGGVEWLRNGELGFRVLFMRELIVKESRVERYRRMVRDRISTYRCYEISVRDMCVVGASRGQQTKYGFNDEKDLEKYTP